MKITRTIKPSGPPAPGHLRDEAASQRDDAARERDELAAQRDRDADVAVRRLLELEDNDQVHALRVQELCARGLEDRKLAARDRVRAKGDRRLARADREFGRSDREESKRDREQAATDELTGARRRGVGLEDLQREMDRARRTGGGLVAAYVDVDGLKGVNDKHGHHAGDKLLYDVAEGLRRGMRSYDLLVRLGGDEFLCVLPGVTATEARRRFDLLSSTLPLGPTARSVSVGVAELLDGESPQQLIDRADHDLLTGRGRPSRDVHLDAPRSPALLKTRRRVTERRRADAPGVMRALRLKLTGAMIALIVLDGAGYLLAVSYVSHSDPPTIWLLRVIFVAAAALTVAVSLILRRMIGRALTPVADAANRLVTEPLGRRARALNGSRDALAVAEERLERNLRQQTAVAALSRLALDRYDLRELVEKAATISGAALGRRVAVSIRPSTNSSELCGGSCADGGSSIPIVSREELLGVLRVENPPAPTADELAFLEATANVIADTIQRLRAEEVMRQRALHDPLTGLPNRTLLGDRLTHALQRSTRSGGVAVLFLDLDNFKLINDSHGHRVGDELLCSVATRLQTAMRPGDTVARFGGDEFCIVCDDIDDAVEALGIAERVIKEIGRPFALQSGEHFASVSLGIALADGLLRPAEDLIREADAAMYRAKDDGRGRFEIFDEVMRENATERLRLEHDLRRALDGEGGLIAYYQPIVALPSGAVIGFEALVRWQHPARGLVLPGEFIAVAEDSDVIDAIGDYVLRLACEQAACWIAALDRRPLSVSVNLSPRQVADPGLAARVGAILEHTRLDPDRLQLEITENALVEESEPTEQNLRELKALGVSLVLDDFGTGYSSLAYLRRFPIDAIKIDRRFIAGVGRASEDKTIIEAILRMAIGLRMAVIAEGVETVEQAAILHGMGCRRGQGFLWSKPLPAAEATALLDLAAVAAPTAQA